MSMNDLEKSMWEFEKLDELGFKITINRIRKLVRGLCLDRRKADAFAVFNAAVASKVPCDAAVCSDLIDLLEQVHFLPPHFVRLGIPTCNPQIPRSIRSTSSRPWTFTSA